MGYAERVLSDLKSRYPWEKEFLQAATEILESLALVVDKDPKFEKYSILERMVEPERTILFRVPWMDDNGKIHVNRGFRVQFNSAIGPYKGGCRFAPNVTLGMLKFLGFEQIFKNSLTGLPMGGGKGGSDFDPNGKSDAEVMRFCQAFMLELYRHIGQFTDVPAGDQGVGAREIGYMYGYYRKIVNRFEGVLTGKGATWGGSLIRPEATGYGTVYFAAEMLKTKGELFKDKRVVLSGFGNVTWGAALKVRDLGGKVVAISGPDGYVLDEDGVNTDEKIEYLLEMRASGRNVVEDYAKKFPSAKFFAGKRPWEVKCDVALPCATQNELDDKDANTLVANGCMCVAEGSNMASTLEAVEILRKNVLYGPGKAANAGGVAVSGLEMSQNSERIRWSAEKVDEMLLDIMQNIHANCVSAAEKAGCPGDYVVGANLAGFFKVAEAMMQQGITA
jgi:glutamate dehydrogenase (NADP+)